MIEACKQFLKDRILEIEGDRQLSPFEDGVIFFEPMPRDFLKTHQFAACCLVLHDKKKKDGSLVSNVRDEACEYYIRTRKRFSRKIMFRITLYAEGFGDQWGKEDIPGLWDFDAYTGFIDQLEQKIAEHKVIADGCGNAVKIDLQDSIRPWNNEEAKQMLKRRPHKAIVRVEFTGGIYVQKKIPIIKDVDIQSSYQ